jgi:hypothetical protein
MFLDDRLDQQLREPGIVLWQCYVARRQREHNRIAAITECATALVDGDSAGLEFTSFF